MSVGAIKEKTAAWFAEARANPLFLTGLVAAAAVALLDQASKFWIVNVVHLPIRRHIEISSIFDLTYTCNRGASFGLMAGGLASRVLLSSISIAIAAIMVVWLGRLKRRFAAAGAALIIGGAIGNLLDRVRFGCVTDFLDFSGVPFPNVNRISEFPFFEVFIGGFVWIFNIADTAINVGFACLILDALLHKDGKAPN